MVYFMANSLVLPLFSLSVVYMYIDYLGLIIHAILMYLLNSGLRMPGYVTDWIINPGN